MTRTPQVGGGNGVSSKPPAGGDPIRVMLIDDAVVVRGLVGRWLGEESDVKVVASHRTPKDAIPDLKVQKPDIVILDIEMPEMDGITALPLILKELPSCAVIMSSTLTRRNAEISLKALSLGASDYIPKPDTNAGLSTSTDFRRDILEKVRTFGRRVRQGSGIASGPRFGDRVAQVQARSAPTLMNKGMAAPAIVPSSSDPHRHLAGGGGIKLRPVNTSVPKALLIGSSTGGPQALTALIKGLLPIIDKMPVLITQHMPPTFTTILAEHLAKASGRPAAEGEQGEVIQKGKIYLAPGGKHMLIKAGAQPTIVLDNGPAVNFCKPAVDPMFDSAVQLWGGSLLACILTGMGSDGANGSGTVVRAGGNVVVQDEATSVVWGMPGATAHAGHACAILPIDQIAQKLVRLASGDRS